MAASSQRWSLRHWPPQGSGWHSPSGSARAVCSGQGRGGMPIDGFGLAAAASVLRTALSWAGVSDGSTGTMAGAQAPAARQSASTAVTREGRYTAALLTTPADRFGPRKRSATGYDWRMKKVTRDSG